MAGQDHNKKSINGNVTSNGTAPTAETSEENISEEYEMLDSRLDELNSALDYLEQKNDDIHEKLKELLQSNIDIRQQLHTENSESPENK